MKVADGVHRIDGTRVGNAYLVETDEGLLVVDTGITGNAGRILRSVEALGHRASDVRYIVLTHSHMDHMGSAARLKRLTGARLAVHELDGPIVAGRELPRKGRRAMRLLIKLFRVRSVEPDVALRDGDLIGGLRVIHVPGHTAGSIALLRPDGTIFAGDALRGDKHGRMLPPDRSLSLDPEQAMASAEKIKALPIALVLPGHGAPVRVRTEG